MLVFTAYGSRTPREIARNVWLDQIFFLTFEAEVNAHPPPLLVLRLT